MHVIGGQKGFGSGLGLALRRVTPPLLLVGLPILWLVMSTKTARAAGVELGFDFEGTLWKPARALIDGARIYPEPTDLSIMVGNPSVYPPLFILLTVPLALIPAAAAAWIWLAVLGTAVFGALWILGVRDWRCYLIALTSPMVFQGLGWGNLTLFLVLPLALTWRYRDRALVSGVSLGLAVAAKLFVLPVVAWLLLTRRFKAAAITLVSATAMIVGPWMLIGFEGFAEYPALLGAVKDVYAARSASFTGALAASGLDGAIATGIASTVALAGIAAAAFTVNRADGDRRAFAIVVAASVAASPIVWPNYFALMFVPVAVAWPRLAPAWFFGYACWLVEFLPKRESVPIPCCRPPDVPGIVWTMSHSVPLPGTPTA